MENNFEKQWSDAFGEYSVPPPDNTWANIEKQLEKEESRKPFIFWWKNPYLWSGVAAAIVIVAGLWNFNGNTDKNILSQKNTDKTISKTELTEQRQVKTLPDQLTNKQKSTSDAEKINFRENNTSSKNFSKTENNTLEKDKVNRQFLAEKIKESRKKESSLQDQTNAHFEILLNEKPIAEQKANTEPLLSEEKAEKSTQDLIMSSIASASYNAEAKAQPIIAYIKGSEIKPYGNRFGNKRKKLPVPEPENELIAKNESTNSGKIKIGLVSGVAPFNPNFSQSGFTAQALSSASRNDAFSNGAELNVSGLPAETGKNNYSSKSISQVPTQSFSAGRSLNLGLSVSKKIKKNFALESGLRMLQANSQLTSNVYSINGSTGDIKSYFANNLADINNNDQTVLSFTETNFQTYNYLSIPLSLLYEIPISQKLSLEASGGLSNDILLNTVFVGQAAQKQNIKATNSDFNLLNFSGTGGLRFNFYFNKNWQVTLGSSMQQALRSGISSSNNITYKPRMTGINYGLLYRLK